ncbi:MAG: hypothetical protein ACJAZX_001067 [Rickettsiales bacterium]|jgi:hypothetical protein
MRKLIIITLILFSTSFSLDIFARGDSYKPLANFISVLPRMIDDGSGKLCVVGYDQVAVELKAKYDNIAFLEIEGISESRFKESNCSIIYISSGDYSVIEIANQAKIPSISIDENFVDKNGMILIEMGRRSFELTINHKLIKSFKTQFDPFIEGLIIN